MKTVAVIGTFDSKGAEFELLIREIRSHGAETLAVNVGTRGPAPFPVEVTAEQVAQAAGMDLAELRKSGDGPQCMQAMYKGLPVVLRQLLDQGKIQGAIGMGGGQGTSVLCSGFGVLPVGLPKVLVTTMAGMGSKFLHGLNDTHLVDSIVDFSGTNDILTPIIRQAGAAIAAMVSLDPSPKSQRPRVAATMFGITTPCVEQCRKILEDAGYDFYPFHANGMGGPAMEALVDSGFFQGVLDLTTTELLQDMVAPGSGCLKRVEAAGRQGLPQVVVPGALDSSNVLVFDKDKFPGRRFHQHNAEVFLMRARPEDSRAVGKVLADKLNRATGKTVVVMPMGGFSLLSTHLPDPEADQALLDTLREELKPTVRLVTVDAAINDPAFARAVCREMMELLPLE